MKLNLFCPPEQASVIDSDKDQLEAIRLRGFSLGPLGAELAAVLCDWAADLRIYAGQWGHCTSWHAIINMSGPGPGETASAV